MSGGPDRIEGYAIVSEDGMLANAQGVMPDTLKFDADQEFFATSLDNVAAVVHGRHSHEQQKNSPQRKRITATHSVAALAPDPENERGVLWNPQGARLDQVWTTLNLEGGALGVIGGTAIFGLFLPQYDVFYLSRAPGVTLPGGVPVFPEVPGRTPEQVLAQHGLKLADTRSLDAGKGVTLQVWRRAT